MRETTLYEPIKLFLEKQSYEVKAEIGAADVVAVRGDESPVVVELKTGFSLSLFHQATERQAITDLVYIAVPTSRARGFRRALKKNQALCRRLGLGLITVRLRDQRVVVHLDPAPYQPRQSKWKKARLLGEFAKRVGDPNIGGTTRRGGLVTAYRQDALRCARFLSENGATKAALVAKGSGVDNARQIMSDNHYGWFERVRTGVYDLDSEVKRKTVGELRCLVKYVVSAMFVIVAIIHLFPLPGVFSRERLQSLYGVSFVDPNLVILMRHRAVLFGLLGVFFLAAAFDPRLHIPGFVVGFASVASFLWLASSVGGYNAQVARVFRADILALVCLVVGLVVHTIQHAD